MDADRVQPTYVGCPAAAPRAREARRVAAGVATAGVSRGRLREVASRPDSLPELLVVRVVKASVRLLMVEPGEDDADSWSAASRGCKVPGAPKGLLTPTKECKDVFVLEKSDCGGTLPRDGCNVSLSSAP